MKTIKVIASYWFPILFVSALVFMIFGTIGSKERDELYIASPEYKQSMRDHHLRTLKFYGEMSRSKACSGVMADICFDESAMYQIRHARKSLAELSE